MENSPIAALDRDNLVTTPSARCDVNLRPARPFDDHSGDGSGFDVCGGLNRDGLEADIPQCVSAQLNRRILGMTGMAMIVIVPRVLVRLRS